MFKIVTNGKPRLLHALADLPKKVQKDFDYIEGDDVFSPRMVKYKGVWYDTGDVQSICVNSPIAVGWGTHVKPEDPLAKWHAVVSETFFSGVLFRYDYDKNGEGAVVVGSYFS